MDPRIGRLLGTFLGPLALVVIGHVDARAQIVIPTASEWGLHKGTAEASTPAAAWRSLEWAPVGFTTARAPFYYDTDASYTGNTRLADMRGGYTSIHLRREFTTTEASGVSALRLRFQCDDGFVIWLNGVLVTNYNHNPATVAFDATAASSVSEPPQWITFTVPIAPGVLREGTNLAAVQGFNQSRTSSDFLLDLELALVRPDTAPPRIVAIDPPPGTVTQLDRVKVTFSEPVTGVGFSDLWIDQRPAVGMEGGGDTYTFLLPALVPGTIRVGWDPGAGINDLGVPPNPFDTSAAGATWEYRFEDRSPPRIVARLPRLGGTVRSLGEVEVLFDEPVSGIDAADLLVNGVAATGVTGSGAGPYRFAVAPAPAGVAQISWRIDHAITDLASPPNSLVPEPWNALVDPSLPPPTVRINEFLAEPAPTGGLRDEDDEPSDWIELHNSGAAPVNLSGWALSDDPAEPGKWTLPDIAVAPGGYLVVFASGKARSGSASQRIHTNFRLASGGEYLGLYNAESPREIVSELRPQFPIQRPGHSYGQDSGGIWRHYPTPTPGAANAGPTAQGVLEPIAFNVERGLMAQPFDLHLSHPDPAATIRFTLDGSAPTATTGTAWTGPLRIGSTTIVRAAAFRAGWLPSAIGTHTYVFPDAVARQPANPPGVPATWIDAGGTSWTADYGMDPEIVEAVGNRERILAGLRSLPSMSLVTRPEDMFANPTGIYPKSQQRGPSWERTASLEIIEPGGGPTVQVDCGVQMQGNSVRDPVKTAKHAFRLVFKDDYGDRKLQWRLFPQSPVEEFDTFTLRADFNNSWMHWNGTQRPRGQRIRDAWVKDSQRAMGGMASHNRFFHLYINGLYWGVYDATERPDAAYGASHLGGTKTDYDVVNEGALVDGDMVAYRAMTGITSAEAATVAGYERMAGYLDIPAYIDYVLLHFFVGHSDWFTDKNWYALRPRTPNGRFRYLAWDGEMTLAGNGDNVVTRTDQASNLHPRLVGNPQYRLDFADRVQRHLFNDGALTPAANIARYRRRLDEVEPSMVAESARWGDYRRDVHAYSSAPYELYTYQGHFITERSRLLTQYFPARTTTVLNQLRAAGLYPAVEAPTVTPSGGRVGAGTLVTVRATIGTAYYTLDGSDPRVRHTGAVAPGAQPAGGAIPLAASTRIRVRTLSNNVWSALVEADFEVGSTLQPLRFTEVRARPEGGDPYEYLELQNTGTAPLDLGGYSMDGVRFVFPTGYILPPGSVTVLASDESPAAFAARHPGVTVAGWFGGTLADSGERLSVLDPDGRVVATTVYPDATAAAFEPLDPGASPSAYAAWQSRPGSPGQPPAPGATASIRLNEIHAGEDQPGDDWLELANPTPQPLDLAGWTLTDGTLPSPFRFPAGSTIPAGGFLRVWCDTNSTPDALHTGFRLGRSGDSIVLADASGDIVDAVGFGPQTAGFVLVRQPDLSWAVGTPTPEGANNTVTLAAPTALRWNEWLANPPPGDPDWIELHNTHPALPILLDGMLLRTAQGQVPLPTRTVLGPGGFIQLRLGDATGAAGIGLPASGGPIALLHPHINGLDSVAYGSQAEGVTEGRFPDGAATIQRFPGNPTPAAPNRPLTTAPGLRLNEVLAWNAGAVPHPADPEADGLELANTGATAVALGGHRIVSGNRTWTIPEGVVLGAGGFLWLDATPRLPASLIMGARLNTGFGFDRDGDGVRLVAPNGATLDAIAFGPQAAGLSIGRDEATWRLLAQPSPGGANGPAAVPGPAESVRINEWVANSADGDWIELFNTAVGPASLEGISLLDSPAIGARPGVVFPPLSFIGGRGLLRIRADREPDRGPTHADFQITASGEALILARSDGGWIDAHFFGNQPFGRSSGRVPDGGALVNGLAWPTPGAPNFAGEPLPPVLQPPFLRDGGWQIRAETTPGILHRLEWSTDLTEWESAPDVRPEASSWEWIFGPVAPEPSERFFRLRLVP